MRRVDVSRATHHKMQSPVNHPTIEVYPFGTHLDASAHFDDRRRAAGPARAAAQPLNPWA